MRLDAILITQDATFAQGEFRAKGTERSIATQVRRGRFGVDQIPAWAREIAVSPHDYAALAASFVSDEAEEAAA